MGVHGGVCECMGLHGHAWGVCQHAWGCMGVRGVNGDSGLWAEERSIRAPPPIPPFKVQSLHTLHQSTPCYPPPPFRCRASTPSIRAPPATPPPLRCRASTPSIRATPATPPPLQVQSPEQVDKTVAGWVLQLRVMAVVAASELVLASSIWPSPVDEEVFSAVMAKVGPEQPPRDRGLGVVQWMVQSS